MGDVGWSRPRRPFLGPLAATAIVYAWSLAFWFFFLDLLAWGVFRIPMGLGGAIYPALFTVPVLLGTYAYELAAAFVLTMIPAKRSRELLLTMWLPAAIVAMALVVACPMDTAGSGAPESFLGYVFWRLL
ncbi:MAG TPA: hypothetical protein VLT61_14410 [Anaeromyxobacteraceae bacterium]|nr:hypothetical protein [Anaeromyxobacteraceae bacterium]